MSVNDNLATKSNFKAAALVRAAADILKEDVPGRESAEIEDVLRVVIRDLCNMRIPERRTA